MKLSPSDAALLSPAERELVEARGPFQVKDLVKRIQRTRRLRDKSRDLLQRQTVSNRRSGNVGGTRDTNARTGAKARVFERALENYRKQLEAIDAESSRACAELARTDAAEAKKSASRKPAAKKAGAGKAATKKAGAKKAGAKKASAGRGSDAAVKPAAKSALRRGTAPRKAVSKKARVSLPRSLGGPNTAQTVSQASRRTRAKKSARRG